MKPKKSEGALALVILALVIALAITIKREVPNRPKSPTNQPAMANASVDFNTPALASHHDLLAERGSLTDTTSALIAGASVPDTSRVPTGSIQGYVRDDYDQPVAAVSIGLYLKDKLIASMDSEESGSFRFDGLGPANYSIRTHSNSLPGHLLGPWMPSQGSPGQGNDYQAKKVVMPEKGGTFEVELRVFIKSIAWGRVISAEGEPIEKAQVRLQSAAIGGQPSSLNASGETDKEGHFELINIYPGLYILQSFSQLAVNQNHRSQPAPIPRAIQILPGADYDLGVIRHGGGKNSVIGRVLDELGVPFSGLPVIAFPAGSPGEGFMEFKTNSLLATTETDELGNYRLDMLPDASIKIRVGADYLEKPLGEAQAAFWIPAQVLTVSGGKQHAAQESILPRSRPFRIFGTVAIGEQADAERHSSYGDVSLKLTLVNPNEPFPPNRPAFNKSQKHSIDPSTGAFEVLLETPHPAVRVIFSSRRMRLETVEEVVFDLPPNGQLELFPKFQ